MKPKQNQLQWPITKEANTRNRRQARENACDQVAIGFGFASDWLRRRREFFKPTTERQVIPKQFRKTALRITPSETLLTLPGLFLSLDLLGGGVGGFPRTFMYGALVSFTWNQARDDDVMANNEIYLLWEMSTFLIQTFPIVLDHQYHTFVNTAFSLFSDGFVRIA